MTNSSHIFQFSGPSVQDHFQARITLKDQILEHAELVAKEFLCYITDIKVISRIEKVQLYIARNDLQPVGMHECSKINSEFCKLLDIYLPKVREKFNIEVISAGLDRVIRTNEEFNHALSKRMHITHILNDQQFYNTFYLLQVTEDNMILIQESTLIKTLENKEAIQLFSKLLSATNQQLNKKTKSSKVLETYVRVLSQLLNNNEQKIDQEIFNKLINLCKFTTIPRNALIKVKLAPLFD